VVRGQCDPICRPGVAHPLVFTAPDQLAAVTTQFLRHNV